MVINFIDELEFGMVLAESNPQQTLILLLESSLCVC